MSLTPTTITTASTTSSTSSTTASTTFVQYMPDPPPVCPTDFYNLPHFSAGPQLSSMACYAPYQTGTAGDNITKTLEHCCGGPVIVAADELHRGAGQIKDCYFFCNVTDRVNASRFPDW